MLRFARTTLFAAALILLARDTVWSQVMMKVVQPLRTTTVPVAPAAEKKTGSSDETLLRSVGISTDGPGLLTYFRLRSQSEVKPDRIAALIEQLSDKSPAVAQKALGELASLGAPAIPALRQASKDPDQRQTVLLAQRCLHALEDHPGQLSSAAARLLGQIRPRGTVEAFLNFLPVAEEDSVIEEIRLALAEAGYPDGNPDPALLKALQDESPIRRALAIDTLCQNGLSPAVMAQVPLRKLLQDPKPSVRLRAALAMARARDAKAVSTLITLLTDLPVDQARLAEDFLSELAGDQAPKTLLASDLAARQKCRDAWAQWWQASEDSDRLLEEVRKRTITDAIRQKCEKLIGQLGDSDFSVREKAQAEVKAMGSRIVPLLRQAARHQDLEIRNRARECLSQMERDKNVPLSPITTRLIALRKPAGAAEALLAFLPFADDETLATEAQLALNVVAFKDSKPEPAVVRSLSDSLPARRAAAAEALCLGGDREHLPIIRKMLSESDLAARLKIALALAGIRERQAVPTLIQLISELPSSQSEPAEEYLQRLAGEHPPASLPPGDNDDNRKKRQTAWNEWWKTHGERAILVDRYPPAGTERYHGYVLLVLTNSGQVIELGTDRKVRWQLNGLAQPRDVQVLAADRILVAEYTAQRVTERNRAGEVIWQKMLPQSWPLGVQRLRNGHTFITCQNKLVEVDRGGNEVFTIDRPQNDVVMARKMRDGSIVLVSTFRQCIRMNTAGKQLKSYPIQVVWQNGVDILPNGHVVVPAQWMNRVLEYDTEGKTVWEANSTQPCGATRLPNGNHLVAPQVWPAKIVEMDHAGKEVAEFTAPNFVYRIRVR